MNFVKSQQFEADQLHIEDHVFESNGRQVQFVLKYLVVKTPKVAIILKRIIDNREQNLEIYPAHKLDSFSADDE